MLGPDPAFAALPEPSGEAPVYAVIFSSRRTSGDDQSYAAAAARVEALAREQPGFLGVESARDADGFGITVSYWRDEAAIRAWKMQAEHRATREHGREHWYAHYELRVAKVERAYGKPPADG